MSTLHHFPKHSSTSRSAKLRFLCSQMAIHNNRTLSQMFEDAGVGRKTAYNSIDRGYFTMRIAKRLVDNSALIVPVEWLLDPDRAIVDSEGRIVNA